jgi:hypothetical protein
MARRKEDRRVGAKESSRISPAPRRNRQIAKAHSSHEEASEQQNWETQIANFDQNRGNRKREEQDKRSNLGAPTCYGAQWRLSSLNT